MNATVEGSGKVVDWKEREGGQKEREVVVIPGFWDGHGHLLQLGEMLEGVKLYGVGSVEGAVVLATGSMNEGYFINSLCLSCRSPHLDRGAPQS